MPNLTGIDALETDIAQTIGQYPKLVRHTERHLYYGNSYGLPYLEGWIDIRDQNGKAVDSAQVQICFTEQYPYRYPRVYEIGGRFPVGKWMMLHVNSDRSLCLDVIQREIIHARFGLSTNDFIASVLIPNLAWRIHKLDWPDEKFQEHAHGSQGILDEYKLKLDLRQKSVVIKAIETHLSGHTLDEKSICYCGSRLLYRNCHQSKENYLGLLPSDLLKNHLAVFKKDTRCK